AGKRRQSVKAETGQEDMVCLKCCGFGVVVGRGDIPQCWRRRTSGATRRRPPTSKRNASDNHSYLQHVSCSGKICPLDHVQTSRDWVILMAARAEPPSCSARRVPITPRREVTPKPSRPA